MARTPLVIRSNSIGFLRFVLATLVVITHSYGLGGFGNDPVTAFSHTQDFGILGVGGFFFLSGFLITRSNETAGSAWRYLWHRFLRIFPGFWVCLLVTAFGFGVIAALKEDGSLARYFQFANDGAFRYVTVNWLLAMRQYPISDLLRHNPYPVAFDGSLWTLIIEFECYLAVAVLGYLGFFRRHRQLVVALLAGLMCVTVVLPDLPSLTHSAIVTAYAGRIETFLDLWVYFFIGSCIYLYRDAVPIHRYLFALAVVALLVSYRLEWNHVLTPLAYSYCLFWLAFRLPLRGFDRHGDFSYGLYIYAFPVQQLLALYALNRYGLVAYFLLSMLLTLPLAVLSWYLVEKRCLRLKNLQFPRILIRSRVPAPNPD